MIKQAGRVEVVNLREIQTIAVRIVKVGEVPNITRRMGTNRHTGGST